MDCVEVKKYIQEYFDGNANDAEFAAHLKHCAECRAYFTDLRQQQEALSGLHPNGAPAFDLVAAKRRKHAQRTRMLRRCSVAAAAFVVLLAAGTAMQPFFSTKSYMAESAEDTIAYDTAAYDGIADGATNAFSDEAASMDCADALTEDCIEEPVTKSQTSDAARYDIEQIISAEEFDALYSALSASDFLFDADESRILFPVTDESLSLARQYYPASEPDTTILFVKE